MSKNSAGDVGLVPLADEIDAKKLNNGANVQTDTFNAAQKLRRMLVDTVGGCCKYDCMHHLYNVWFGNIKKKPTTSLLYFWGQTLTRLICGSASRHQSVS